MASFKQGNPGCCCQDVPDFGYGGCPCDPSPPDTLFLTVVYSGGTENHTLTRGVCNWCLFGLADPNSWYSTRFAPPATIPGDPDPSGVSAYHEYALECVTGTGMYRLVERRWSTASASSAIDYIVATFVPGGDQTCTPLYLHDGNYVISA